MNDACAQLQALRSRSTLSCSCYVLAGVAAVFFAGCRSQQTTGAVAAPPQLIESSRRYVKLYVLAPGDVIEVNVRGNATVSRQVIIRPDGYISLPLLDGVRAAGLTIPDLDARLTELFAQRLEDPELSVIAVSVREPMVYVVGDVASARPVPLRLAHTAAQALATVGGFTRDAADRQVALIRLGEDGTIHAHTLTPELEGQPSSYMVLQATILQAGDILMVPESDRSQFVRFIRDYINTPLVGVNQILQPYFQLRVLEEIDN